VIASDAALPLIVQSDRTILLETHGPLAAAARDAIAPFAELVKSPEHIHTYRLTPLSIWNARSAGLGGAAMVDALRRYAKYPVPESIATEIEELAGRYGRATLRRRDGDLVLEVRDLSLAEELSRDKRLADLLAARLAPTLFRVPPERRGLLKQALVAAGYPAEDLAGYVAGERLPIRLRERCASGAPLNVRPYQREAAEAFHQRGSERGGSGVIVLPCGAGKTIVGLAAMEAVGETTLVLCTNRTAVKQWQRELLDKTDLAADAIAEYTGERKEVGPVTISTYQILTHRPGRDEEFPHFALFNARPWGLIIYDEVHLLPAPVFRITAGLQARRRLGLTATLVREDGREEDVFALIGPKRYDVPWRDLERQGWIAEAVCTEIRVPLDPARRMEYALAEKRAQFRIAAENPAKTDVVRSIVERAPASRLLVIGEYIAQLEGLARTLGFPLVTGKTPQPLREDVFARFRTGEVGQLILSRVGNFSLDLPEAETLIQVSGTFGSRQEEAQRLGRILRPKADGRQARFFTIVSRETREEDFARHRQLFLTEQGYAYRIEIAGGDGG